MTKKEKKEKGYKDEGIDLFIKKMKLVMVTPKDCYTKEAKKYLKKTKILLIIKLYQ